MDFQTIKDATSHVGRFIAPDFWACGAILKTDEDGIDRLEGRITDYAIHSIEVTGRGIDYGHFVDGLNAVRVRVTFAVEGIDGGMGPGSTTGAWMGVA